MAKVNRTEILPAEKQEAIQSEIRLMMRVEDIETRLAADSRHLRFAELAEAYLALGDIDEAVRICDEGMKHFPFYSTVQLVMARAYEQKGDRQKAASVLQEFLNTHPSSLVAHRMLGEFALSEKNIRKALKHFRIALRLDPVNRGLIQQFVEVRDEFQKIKDSVPAEDDESDDAKPIIMKKVPEEIKSVKTIDRVLDEVLDIPASFKTAELDAKEKTGLTEEPSAQPFMFETEPAAESRAVPEKEIIVSSGKEIPVTPHPVEEKIITGETQDLLHDDEAIPVQPAVTVQPVQPGGMNPVYTDEFGIMYFYDDDEVSFDQYKKRYDLQKAGKAKIMNRARLDEKLALLGIVSSQAERKAGSDMDFSFQEAETETPPLEPEKEKYPEPVEPGLKADTENLVRESLSGPEPEALEEETAFEEIEMSYRDYLDILTEESDLLEAMMGDVPQEPVTEEIATALVSKIVGEAAGEGTEKEKHEEEPVSYSDYVTSLTDPEEMMEAGLETVQPVDSEEDMRVLSLAEFALELDLDDDLIDFQTYKILSPADAEHLFPPDSTVTGEPEEPAIHYRDYLGLLATEEEISDATLELVAPEKGETAAEPVRSEKAEIIEPVYEKAQELRSEEIHGTEPEMLEPVEETRAAISEIQPAKDVVTEEKTTEKPKSAEVKETVVAAIEAEEETGETEEAFETEEDIDPRDASLELVDQLAQFGQFGTAYKVCKMLKLKNPTDAKVDRKILELKRLYLWSSQLVG